MATHAPTTPTTATRRWSLPFGGPTARRCPAAGAAPRRSILRLLAKGITATVIPSAILSTPSPAAARPAFAPALLASDPAKPMQDWQAAQAEAVALAAELRQARATLEQRIGPRGLVLGSLTLPSGRTVPLRASSPDHIKKLWGRLNLGPEVSGERASVVEAVRAACARWDEHAARAGLGDLERRAAGARDRARVLTGRAVTANAAPAAAA